MDQRKVICCDKKFLTKLRTNNFSHFFCCFILKNLDYEFSFKRRDARFIIYKEIEKWDNNFEMWLFWCQSYIWDKNNGLYQSVLNTNHGWAQNRKSLNHRSGVVTRLRSRKFFISFT